MVWYSGAGSGSLALSFESESVVLCISDDGKGFTVPESPAEFAPSGHFGLLGLYERADLIGAQINIHSKTGEGTRLEVVLAIPQPENENGYADFT